MSEWHHKAQPLTAELVSTTSDSFLLDAYFDLPSLCQQSPHTPDLRIFYGKKPDPDTPGSVNLDHVHATRFSILPNCTLQAFEDSGHAVVKYLIDNHLIDQLLLKTIFDVSD